MSILKIIQKMKPQSCQENKDHGFTILETLIAFIIMSFSIGAAVQVISLSKQKISRADEYTDVLKLFDEVKLQISLSRNSNNNLSGLYKNDLRWEAVPIVVNAENQLQVFSIIIRKQTSSAEYRFLHSQIIDN